MLKMYCQSCGALHAYASAKPNFCQKCGKKFAGATEGPIKGQGVKVEEKKAHIPTNIQGLDVEIELDQHRNTMTMSDLMKTADPNSKPQQLPDRPGKPEGMDIMQEFQREAGSIKHRPPAPEQ